MPLRPIQQAARFTRGMQREPAGEVPVGLMRRATGIAPAFESRRCPRLALGPTTLGESPQASVGGRVTLRGHGSASTLP